MRTRAIWRGFRGFYAKKWQELKESWALAEEDWEFLGRALGGLLVFLAFIACFIGPMLLLVLSQ